MEHVKPNDEQKIELISGHNKVLVIAPHGVYRNDDNTGKIVRQVAKKLGCYAVINEKYRKPKKTKDKQTGIIKKESVNQLAVSAAVYSIVRLCHIFSPNGGWTQRNGYLNRNRN